MSLSVVIPTWNEGLWLARLLSTLRDWDSAIEIVVADRDSTDETRAIAQAYGCRTVAGGTPAVGRNRGASAASGHYLLFVDADVLPTPSALRAVREEVESKAGDVVSFRHAPLSDERLVCWAYAIADAWFRCLHRIGTGQGFASFLVVSRRCFEGLGGFDEGLDPGEDVDLVRRATRTSRVRHRRDCSVLVSPRRFWTEPRLWFAAKTALWAILRLSSWRANPLPYRWMPHNPACAEREARWIQRHRFS